MKNSIEIFPPSIDGDIGLRHLRGSCSIRRYLFFPRQMGAKMYYPLTYEIIHVCYEIFMLDGNICKWVKRSHLGLNLKQQKVCSALLLPGSSTRGSLFIMFTCITCTKWTLFTPPSMSMVQHVTYYVLPVFHQWYCSRCVGMFLLSQYNQFCFTAGRVRNFWHIFQREVKMSQKTKEQIKRSTPFECLA